MATVVSSSSVVSRIMSVEGVEMALREGRRLSESDVSDVSYSSGAGSLTTAE